MRGAQRRPRPQPRPRGPAAPLTHVASLFTTTSANSWHLSILCFVLTNISIIFWEMFSALVLDLPQGPELSGDQHPPGPQWHRSPCRLGTAEPGSLGQPSQEQPPTLTR